MIRCVELLHRSPDTTGASYNSEGERMIVIMIASQHLHAV